MFRSFGLPELIVILAIILLLFGATKLPALARSLGLSIFEFKKGMKEGAKETEKDKPANQEPDKEEKKS